MSSGQGTGERGAVFRQSPRGQHGLPSECSAQQQSVCAEEKLPESQRDHPEGRGASPQCLQRAGHRAAPSSHTGDSEMHEASGRAHRGLCLGRGKE